MPERPDRTTAPRVARGREPLRILGRLGWPRPLATVAIVAMHIALGHSDYTLWERFLAGSVAAILLNVLWRYFAYRRTTLPVIEWVLVQLYVFFAMPVFSEGASTRSITFDVLSSSGAIRDSLLATNLFVTCLLFGWIAWPRRRTRSKNAPLIPLPILLLVGYGVVALLVSWFLSRYEVELREAWYRQVLWLVFSPTLAQLLLLYEYHRKPSSRYVRVALLAFTGAMVLAGLFSSRLSFALVPLVTAGIGVVATGARLPKRLSLVVLFLLVFVNPAKHVYRELTGYRTADFSTQTFGQMADAWVESLTQTWSSDEEIQDEAFQLTSTRLNSLTINAAVIAWVPERVGYAKAAPWLAIPYSVIPRFLWPNKPGLTEVTNDRFAIAFGMSTYRATQQTTSAYPSVADGYWNFGWFGVGLAAFLAGLFWKLVWTTWSPSTRYRYVFPFFLLVNTRATVALPNLLLGVLQTAAAFLLVVKALEILSAALTARVR